MYMDCVWAAFFVCFAGFNLSSRQKENREPLCGNAAFIAI